MAGDSMSTGFPLGAEFSELIGNIQGAARIAKAELRDLERQMKSTTKAGGSISDSDRSRASVLRTSIERYSEKISIQKMMAQELKRSGSAKLLEAGHEAGSISRLLHGGASIESLHEVQKLLGRASGLLVQRGGISARAGVLLGQGSASLGRFASLSAAPAALGAAIGYTGVSIAKESVSRDTAAANSALSWNTRMEELTRSDRRGTRYSADQLMAMDRISKSAGEKITKRLVSASWMESIKTPLYGNPSTEIDAIGTKVSEQALEQMQLSMKYGGGSFGKNTALERFLKSPEAKRKAAERLTKDSYLLSGARGGLTLASWTDPLGLLSIGDAKKKLDSASIDAALATGDGQKILVEEALKMQKESFAIVSKEREAEMARFNERPDVSAIRMQNSRRLQALEKLEWDRHLQWNPY